MDKTKIKKNLKIYVDRLKKTVDPEKIILFGSFASNKATKWSDIDILVVSDFKNIPEKKRDYILYDLSSGLIKNNDYQPYAITPEEYSGAKSWTIISEIKKDGVVLYSKN
ncbi:hypothetical protein A2954_06345 [Candidatus Roizmanbacteria bacterium RIFCSPLOWO2_01_FULL_37_12]|uniref:Polymerase nucleotidyl transferase domain-containing protein n=1 Tax=Candidatus Roizmanbacteria bacterium RIFCSPLOWO2_01_FULL_37_12 TaxID=1802056 RepID=A0A1F7IAU7_9BACT|nr:MAG: hypothetical protein A2768_01685 [Candidatus Roizmanbacteria bacterium RIFCSPHIGHO2_01_FULL_37_16]OGK25775.1 MAG: hypothetical protein A3D76_02190 [Candidatus Roizmanbacteria bacterium RIFCSPHIGHO2_02_FULL_37_9b]OGK40477.1 MAG: hypothetical protein A2954_06345 [Candidatus Roizmanbacteria bacterium RIFCSPLOWO2_01_FULL_37_12]